MWEYEFLLNKNNKDVDKPRLVDIIQQSVNDHYTFPHHYSGLESKNQLIVDLKLAAMQAGFNLKVKTSKTGSQLKKGSYDDWLTICCKKTFVLPQD